MRHWPRQQSSPLLDEFIFVLRAPKQEGGAARSRFGKPYKGWQRLDCVTEGDRDQCPRNRPARDVELGHRTVGNAEH